MPTESIFFSNQVMLALLSALVTVLLVRTGFDAFRLRPRRALNRLFFLLCGCLAFWSLAGAVLPSAPEWRVWTWYRVSAPGWTLTPALALHFALLFTTRGERRRRGWLYLLLYLPAIFFLVQALRGPGRLGVVDFTPSRWGWSEVYGEPNATFVAYLVFCASYLGWALWRLASWARTAELVSQRRSAALLAGAGGPVVVAVGVSGALLPWLGVRELPDLAHVLAALWVLAVRHAIARFRLMSPNPGIEAHDILETISEIVVLVDRKLEILEVNRAGVECFGVERSELVGGGLEVLFTAEDCVRLRDLISGDGPPSLELSLPARDDGASVLLSVSASEIRDHLEQLIAKVLILRDVTEQKRAEEKLRYTALHDALTGLPNRVGLEERLDRAAERAARHKKSFAVLIFDLDDFKDINDSYGHQAGDEVLKHVARMLSHSVRGIDSVCRLAGDEFLLLVEDLERASEVEIVMDRILGAVGRPVSVGEHRIVATGTLGVSIFPHDGSDHMALVKKADLALYSAKAQGKSRYHYFDSAMEEAHRRRIAIERGLRTATSDGSLSLEYQPIVDLGMRRIRSVEALARWDSVELGSVPPGEFIPIAERTGRIAEIGEWVLRTACLQVVEWRRELNREVAVSVNVSARQIHRPGFVDSVEAILAETRIPVHLLELELTETAALEDMDSSERVVKALVALGVRILIDDFGTGHSSLTRLRRLPMHAVKIDRSFIRNLQRQEKDRAMVSAIIDMARALHVGVIAEGVETMNQLSTLESMLEGTGTAGDPQRLQGFLFSRPVPAEELEALLLDRTGGAVEPVDQSKAG